MPETAATIGTPLRQILEPFEAQLLAGSSFDAYRLEPCHRPPTKADEGDADLVDREQSVGRGDVLVCSTSTVPPADAGGDWWIIVLDNTGTFTWWLESTDGIGAPPIAPSGLLCREYLALPAFASAMANLGDPPWGDDEVAYQFVLAYWFFEGEPARMDVDGNGVPCELIFDPAVVAAIWAGGF